MTMMPIDQSGTSHSPHAKFPETPTVDLSEARKAYVDAMKGKHPERHHAEVGILSPSGKASFHRLGMDEAYGAHRVGSVTKTFTAFLALKLTYDGILINGLKTKCKEVIPPESLKQVFQDPESAGEMTLEQLLSHTSGMELDDHCRSEYPRACSSLNDRFLQETSVTGGRKYVHVTKPGDDIGFYSNAGLAVAGWLMEVAYNKNLEGLYSLSGISNRGYVSFADIMQKEIFEGVFDLSDSVIAPGPTGDIIQSACGDMTSSTSDLIQVAKCLQQGRSFS